MSYGMDYKDYWYGDIFQTYYVLKAYRLKLKAEDEYMWMQGMYVYEAILDCARILHPFSKATKPLPYSEQPYLHKVEQTQKQLDEEERQKQIENVRLKAQIWIKNWVRQMKKANKK